MIRACTALALAALLGGCDRLPLPGPVAQLDRFTRLQADGQLAEIAATPVVGDCAAAPFGSEACPRIHAIRGRACLGLARAEAAAGAACPPPTPTARRNLDCAVESYALAAGASPAGSPDALNQSDNRARALSCAAPFRPPAEALGMARSVAAELAPLPVSPARSLLAASASLAVAQRADIGAAERCAAAREAVAQARRGLGAAPEPAAARALRGSIDAATREAATLPGCAGVGA